VDRIVIIGRFDHIVLLVAAQPVLGPEGGADPEVAAGGERVERMGEVLGHRGRMGEQGDTAAGQWRAQRGVGEEAVEAGLHPRV
jgi:hypothetical protein